MFICLHVSMCGWRQEVAAELGYSKIGLRAMAERVLGAQMPKSNSVRCLLMTTMACYERVLHVWVKTLSNWYIRE